MVAALCLAPLPGKAEVIVPRGLFSPLAEGVEAEGVQITLDGDAACFVLIQPQPVGFQHDMRRPAAPVTSDAVERGVVGRFIKIIDVSINGAHGDGVDLPRGVFIAKSETQAVEGADGVAVAITRDQTAVRPIKGHATKAEAQRCVADDIIEMKLRVGLQDFEFVLDVGIVQTVTEETAGVLQLDGEAERVERVFDAEVKQVAGDECVVG